MDTPDEGTEGTVPEEIRALSALDTESGMAYCGDAGDYLEALSIYHGSVEEKAARMEALLDDAELENLSLLLHSVKSTSRAVGAMALAEQAAALEQAAKTGTKESLRQGLTAFLRDYRALGVALQKAMEESFLRRIGYG